MPLIISSQENIIESSSVGLIIPPPELRNTIDKTAEFVARNGKEFEKKILERESENKKFNFLKPVDPYHKYYQRKIFDYNDDFSKTSGIKVQQKQQQILYKLIPEEFIPDKTPDPYHFIIDPPSISPQEINILKLTAQFVSRNGRKFLTDLMIREQKNPEFDFLRPQHALFPYFAKLLEQYTKILIPPKDIINDLKIELSENGKENLMKEVDYRAKYLQYQEKQQRLENEKVEKERLEYQSINWHDFVVVETIEYYPDETGDFPPPITPETIGARLINEMRENEDYDIEMQLESDNEEYEEGNENIEEEIEEENQPKLTNKFTMRDGDIIIKNYDPKEAHKKSAILPRAPEAYLISPLTGEQILASKFEEHMRINLLDPRWIEQRQRLIEKSAEDSAYASGTTVISNLKQLAERRTDIFGEGDQETAIGRKIGEEKTKDNRIIWDGHSSSLESTARAMQKNISSDSQNNRIIKDVTERPTIPLQTFKQPTHPVPQNSMNIGPRQSFQNNFNFDIQTHREVINIAPNVERSAVSMTPYPSYTFPLNTHAPSPVPPPPFMMQSMFPTPSSSVPPHFDQNMDICNDDPLNLNEKLIEDCSKNSVSIKIQVPTLADKSEWNLNGQLLSFDDIKLIETVLSLKQRIQEKTGMPPAKQKLSFDKNFLKDPNMLSSYNLTTGSIINLQIKERGGRKK